VTATPYRLRRLEDMFAAEGRLTEFETIRANIARTEPQSQQLWLDALCISWLGPRQKRWTRSDKGCWREPKQWHYRSECRSCGSEYPSNRTDSRYCSPACRQKAYRNRKTEGIRP
jgi:hypothetical protein